MMSYNVMTFQCLGLRLERAVAFRPNMKGQFIDALIERGAKTITGKETIHGYDFH
jgi:hypothetical protein